jgi:hypothetical protein
MKSIREVAGQTLRWTQPNALRRRYELRAGSEVVATMRWEKTFGSSAIAESADGNWTFRHTGIFRSRISARATGSESEVAVFKPNWRGEGTVQGPAGRSYQWSCTSFWRSQWRFARAEGETLIRVTPGSATFRQTADVHVEAGAAALPDLALLTLLGFYLIVLMSDDPGAAGAVAAMG